MALFVLQLALPQPPVLLLEDPPQEIIVRPSPSPAPQNFVWERVFSPTVVEYCAPCTHLLSLWVAPTEDAAAAPL